MQHKTPQIGLATERFRAIDLSCRACGAGAWALGLDSRLGPPPRSGFHPQPPIYRGTGRTVTMYRVARFLYRGIVTEDYCEPWGMDDGTIIRTDDGSVVCTDDGSVKRKGRDKRYNWCGRGSRNCHAEIETLDSKFLWAASVRIPYCSERVN